VREKHCWLAGSLPAEQAVNMYDDLWIRYKYMDFDFML
jgi:hypothetical protein